MTASAHLRNDIAALFHQALLKRDFAAVEQLLAPDLWFRALLSRETLESHDPRKAIDASRRWFDAEDLRVVLVGVVVALIPAGLGWWAHRCSQPGDRAD